jgi:uncharacterized repeat protein (TIGR01451 family)
MLERPLAGRLRLPASVAAILLALALPGPGRAQDVDVLETPPAVAERIPVLVELAEPPAAVIYGRTLQENAGLPVAQARALAAAAARRQVALVRQAQSRFDAALASLPVATTEIYRVSKALDAIALIVDPAQVAALRKLPGVKSVRPLKEEFPTNSTSVPFLGAPQAWADTLGLGLNADGTGIRIGIIDTGIDYQHADFGGTGALADYQANNRTVAPDSYFPTAKVVGGWDFAGDAYSGSATPPAPDPDPMDCNGHGTHVAGTAAGFGVNPDGTSYAGPWGPSTPFGTLRIGPGTAPKAQLYALRVFGCGGGTNLTAQAIDWAVDPNGDDDLSDHLDVINMSLGSPFGGTSDASAAAAENAALAGVIVVTSAGNSGDTFYISGTPGSAGHAIATAAIGDPEVALSALKVTAPAAIAGGYSAGAASMGGPALANQTGQVVLADDGVAPGSDACTTLTVANAAAMVGKIALIDRGTCNFQHKVAVAQAAGAIGAIVVNNVSGDPIPIGMGATVGEPAITIPALLISLADGNAIKAQLGSGVTAVLAPVTGADSIAIFSSRGPRSSSPMRLKPDIAAPGLAITSAQTGVTCTSSATGCIVADATGYKAGGQTLILQGTSMASPHMAGIMALLRQLHPDWTVEELKALAMNNALHGPTLGGEGAGPKISPSRIGAGRVDVPLAATGQVLAFNADDPGLVSLSFDIEVMGTVTRTKKLRLVNTGTADQAYDLSIATVLDAPGVAFSLPGGSSVTVPAGGSLTIDVQMTGNAAQMDHAIDPSYPTGQVVTTPGSIANLYVPRQWATEEAGYVVLSQGGNTKLRVPVYVAPKPASQMSAPAVIATGGAPTGSTTLPLTGTDVCTGTLGAGPTCTGTFPNDVVSLVSPFELQVVSPLNPVAAPPYADLQYVGVAADSTRIWFGVSTWGDWSSPTDVSFTVYIDTNSDGTYDRQIFTTNTGRLARLFGASTQSDLDTFITGVFIPPGSISSVIAASTPSFVNRLSAASADTAVFNNNVLFFGATPAQLGLANTSSPFRYKVETCPGFAPLCQTLNGFHYDDAAGPFSWSGGARGLDFSNGTNLFFDLNGASLPVTWNTANMTANGSQGALLLHHHNQSGRRAEVVLLQGATSADLGVTLGIAPATPGIGQNVTFTVTVTNNGPSAATGVMVNDALPSGLTYVSDDGGGAYDPNLGQWAVGSLAASASATLHIVATVDTSSPLLNRAFVAGGTPLDPEPSNNQAEVTVLAPRSADLALSMVTSAPTVLVGNSVVFTLTVTNNGDDAAYGLNVNEAFPALPSLTPSSFTASRGSFNPATGLWNLANLAKGSTATLALTITAPNMAGALTNNGTAEGGDADPNTANNAASATVTVLSPATVSAIKSVSGSFVEGGTVTYTVVLSNSSSYAQQDNAGHELTDVLPSQLTLVSASATSGTAVATVATNTVTWDGSIPANGSVTVTIQATIKAGTATQTVTNQAALSYDADGNGANEAAATSTAPGGGATSFVVISPSSVGTHTKTVTGSFSRGGTVTYTVVISNPSGSAQLDNPGDEFTDVLPAQLVLVSASATSGTAVAGIPTRTVHWNGAIGAGGSVTITIVAKVDAAASGTISNQGTVFFDADGNGTNESSILTDDPGTATANDPTSFEVGAIASIPTLSEVGLAMLALLLASGALRMLRRRKA